MSRWPDSPNIFLLAILSAASLAGCEKGSPKVAEEWIEKTYDVRPDAQISIQNVQGSIRVYGAREAQVQVMALKRAYSTERLRGIELSIVADETGVKVRTTFPPRPSPWSFGDRSGTVDYLLIVPQTAGIESLELAHGDVSLEGLRGGAVRGEVASGRIVARNCFAPVELSVRRGTMDLGYGWWEEKPFPLRGVIGKGSIKFSAPRTASFQVEARAARGQIWNGFAEPASRMVQKSLSATVGSSPGPTLRLESDYGNVRIDTAY